MAVRASAQQTIIDITDAYSVYLTCASYTFPGTTTAAKAASCTTQVVAMRGSDQVSAAVEASSCTCPTGVSVSSDGDATSPTLTVSVTTAVTGPGKVTIPVTVDGEAKFTLEFAYGVALMGATGAKGVSVTSVTTFWRLDASRPSTPTGTGDPSGWSTTEPTVPDGYSGKEWRCVRTVLSDGAAAWTTPTEVASFAYAHAAWETAGAAMSQATSTSATLDGFKATVASNYQTKGGMSAYATSTELRQTADGLAATASRVASQGEVTAAVERHMDFSADGLVISGGESDGGMSVAIMPDAQEFRSGEDVVMRLDAKTRSVEAQRVTLGGYQWRASEDGSRVSLVYVGGGD